jgi:homoserine O-succinyltransferase/O-acetyltransferase
MSVTIETPGAQSHGRVYDIRDGRRRRSAAEGRARRLVIGLVNNMPDSALLATERQFGLLLEAASAGFDVRLRFYSLAEIARSSEAAAHIREHYADASAISEDGLDALILTGAQPLAKTLSDEPYWRALCSVIDWAAAHTTSTILSCLAAHAGVLHLSGVARRPMVEKCSGVYPFEIAQSDPLTHGAGRVWLAPHSRYNGLAEEDLVAEGYGVLTRSAAVGVDIFVKRARSLLVFLQGHLEYEPDTLAREFRRDMSRYLSGDLAAPPRHPEHYFSAEAERALARFSARVEGARSAEAMASFPDIVERARRDAPWRPSATLFYRNWLGLLADRKAAAPLEESKLEAACTG